MDDLGRLFDEATSTPLGAVLVFTLIYLSRLAIDEWRRERDRPKHAKRKEKHHA